MKTFDTQSLFQCCNMLHMLHVVSSDSLCDTYPHNRAGVHKFSKNLGAISKFKAPEG